MNFFEHQEQARRKGALLVGYYILAVLAIILAIYSVVFLVVAQSQKGTLENLTLDRFFDPQLFLYVALGTGAIILIGSIYKTLQLASGGRAVAESLGGRWVNPESPAADERRLLHVVEEMALASGINVPDVFILEDEDGINAFAAGFTAVSYTHLTLPTIYSV